MGSILLDYRLNQNKAVVDGIRSLRKSFDHISCNGSQRFERVLVAIKEKKTGKLKIFPINNRAREIFSRHRGEYPEDVFLFQSKSNRVKSQPAKAITRESASRAFSEAGEMVTDKNISSHSARKCRGRALWEAGTPIETISKMLNHSNPAVTMTYLDITQDEINQTYHELII